MQLDNMEEVKKVITDFKSIFTSIYDVKKELEDQLSIKDDETTDYLHELELGNLNAIEVMATAKKLIHSRKERRIIKEKLELIKTTKGFVDNYIVKGIVGDLEQVVENIDTLKRNQENRQYTPRILKDLKCAKKKKEKTNE
ncbi:MAG: hypothetical protein IKF38_06870 [Clostridia bacterium]|nr:hypothetical protein [Clostridia bacterium]